MQDVARAAQMSVGNLYRYFPSKTAIIEALIARHFTGIEDDLDAIAACSDPLGRLRAALRERLIERRAGNRVLSAEIAACVARRPELAAVVAQRMESITHRLARIIGPACRLPEAAALTCAQAVCLVVHRAMTGPSARGCDEQRVIDLVFWVLDLVIQEHADEA